MKRQTLLQVTRMLALAGTVVLLAVRTLAADAQTPYPSRPVHVVVAFAAGGFADGISRLIGQKLSERLGQPVVVENRGGAGGNIASRLVAAANADGYTLLANTAAMSINVSLYKNPGFDAFADFVPINITASTPGLFVVHPSNPAGTLQELIGAAKGKRLTYATAGVGSSSHLAGDYLLRQLAGADAVHIPYQGGSPAITAVVANQVDVLSASMPPVMPFIGQGKLKVLAVSSLKRVEALPNVPTVTEAGFPDFEERSWVGFFAPAKTSPEIVNRLNGEINQILGLPDIRERFAALGVDPTTGSPAAFAEYFRAEVAKWSKIVKTIGISAN
jgi:tripartite-type tricarboxylate transporter receptor subunit TctC